MKLDNETVKKLKKDFPIFKRKIHGKPLVYLDSTATTQKPKKVIDAVVKFYEEHNANIHRGVYKLSEEATQLYEEAHEKVKEFIGAECAEEIIFTTGTTMSINLVAHCVAPLFGKGKNEIVLTEMEHHANLVPWQELAKRNGLVLKFVKVKDDFTLDYEDAREKIGKKTALVAFPHVSNALGTINDARLLCTLAKENGALSLIDGAQSVPHMSVDVFDLGCDFLAFSGHKMYGPTGIGVLYGRKELLEKMDPFLTGGDMIREVSYSGAVWNELPMKFEAGTVNICGGIVLGEVIDYLEDVGMDEVAAWKKKLMEYAYPKLKKVKGVTLYCAEPSCNGGVLSFLLEHVHAHDVSSLLDDDAICVRGGHHCCMPLMGKLGIPGTVRASFGVYNTFEDVDKLIESLEKISKMFRL